MDENKNPEPIYRDHSDQEQAQENILRESAATGWGMTTIEPPVSVYDDLKRLAADEQSDPVRVLVRLVTDARQQQSLRREAPGERSEQRTGNVLQGLLTLATDLGVDDLAEQHDHYLYGTEKR